MRISISKDKYPLIVTLAVVGVVALAVLMFFIWTGRVDAELAGIAMTVALGLLLLGGYSLHRREITAENACVEEFGRELPADPARRAVVEKNINWKLKQEKGGIQQLRSQKADLERSVKRRKFLDDAETERVLQQHDDFDAGIEEKSDEFKRRREVARKAVTVYVQT